MKTIQSEAMNCFDKESLLESGNNRLFHYSTDFSKFLYSAIPGIEVRILESKDSDYLRGFMPIAILHSAKFGTAVNTLPFYGSHGGPFALDKATQLDLICQFKSFTESINAASVTLIENPFAPLDDMMIKATGLDIVDDRIGQFTKMPVNLADFHVKTRNAIRKGQGLGLKIRRHDDDASWIWMQTVHDLSISTLGGAPKTLKIFKALRESLGDAVQLWIGSLKGKPVSGVVVIQYRETIEYFTPVVEDAYRSQQALSATIYEVMQRLSGAKFTLWNWGGTWRSQEGVYRFKKRWSAEDYPYRYFNRVYDSRWVDLPRDSLRSAFPYFYLYKH
jgi:hypothetical protein